jgi:hypothetical protein
LPDADRLRRDLDQLVVGDELDRVLERELDRRRDLDRVFLAGDAEVGELLAAHGVDDEVVVARVDADHHALVERIAGLDEHAAAVVELAERVGDGLAVVLADQDAVLAPFDLALVRLVAVEDVADQAGAARQVQELVLEADQAARRDLVVEAHPAHAVRLHVDEVGATLAERLHDGALVLVLDVGGDELDRLEPGVALVVEDDARLRDGELVAFAAHVLEQDRQVQLAAAHDLEDAVLVGVAHLERDVRLQLAVEAVPDLPAGDELAFAAGERRVVDAEVHRQRRLVDLSIGSGSGRSRSVSVTPTPMPSMPLMRTMSPGPASVACWRSRPSNFSTWLTRALIGVESVPSRRRRPASA